MTEKANLDRLFARACHNHYKVARGHFEKLGISNGQPRVLDYLYANSGCMQREIASACNLEPATVSSIINNMEKGGLIQRCNDESDRRVIRIVLTKKGKDTRDTVEKTKDEIGRICFEGFSKDEVEQMGKYIHRMIDNMEKWQQE